MLEIGDILFDFKNVVLVRENSNFFQFCYFKIIDFAPLDSEMLSLLLMYFVVIFKTDVVIKKIVEEFL